NFTAAASVQNTLTSGGGTYTETTPSGTQFLYSSSSGLLQKVVDRYGTPVYYTYDVNSKLRQLEVLSSNAGLLPYLEYDANGLCSALVLRDPLNAANNRTTYFQYDVNFNLTKIIGPEL